MYTWVFDTDIAKMNEVRQSLQGKQHRVYLLQIIMCFQRKIGIWENLYLLLLVNGFLLFKVISDGFMDIGLLIFYNKGANI